MPIFKNLAIALLSVTCFFSCKTKKNEVRGLLTEDSLQIESGFLNKRFNDVNTSAGSYLQGYNPATKELLLFDLKEKKIEMKVRLPVDFKDSTIGSLIQFYIYKPDSIFLLTESHIFITDTAGKIKYDKDISGTVKDVGGDEIFPFDYGNYFPLYFDSEKGELLIHVMCNCDFFDPSYFTKKIEAKLTLASGAISTFNYYFPDRYRHKSYGQAVFPFREVAGNLSVVSFQSEDSLFVYDRNAGKLTKYPCRSRFQEQDFAVFDTAAKGDLEKYKEHLTVSPTYQKILFDQYRNVYYRFFLKGLPLRDEKGVYSDVMNKDVVLMVLDSSFNIIEEKNIGPSYLWYYSFVTPKGLYIQKKTNNTETKNDNTYAYFSVFVWD